MIINNIQTHTYTFDLFLNKNVHRLKTLKIKILERVKHILVFGFEGFVFCFLMFSLGNINLFLLPFLDQKLFVLW